MKKILLSISSLLPALALTAAIGSVQSACWIFIYQPNIPEKLKKYES